MEHMEDVINRAVTKCLSAIKFELFHKQFAPIYENDPKGLYYIYKECKVQVNTNMQKEMKLMFEEENIEGLLKQLEEINQKQDHKQGTFAWRPSGTPATDLVDHYHDIKQEHVSLLRQQLRELEAQNEPLEMTLGTQKEKNKELWETVHSGTTQFDQMVKEITSNITCLTVED